MMRDSFNKKDTGQSSSETGAHNDPSRITFQERVESFWCKRGGCI